MGNKSPVHCDFGSVFENTLDTSISNEQLSAAKTVWDAIVANKTPSHLKMRDQCVYSSCSEWFYSSLFNKLDKHDAKGAVHNPTSGPQLVKLISLCLEEMWRMSFSASRTSAPMRVRQLERRKSDSFISFCDIFLNTLTEVYGESMSSAAVQGWKKLYVVVLRDIVIDCRQYQVFEKSARLTTSISNSINWDEDDMNE
jgi:hypothetical protein